MESTTLRFALAVREIGRLCRRSGLTVPGFRSPPRLAGTERSLRRRSDGGATVSVMLRGRPWASVVADMVEGVVVTNRLQGAAAARCRSQLLAALGSSAGVGPAAEAA